MLPELYSAHRSIYFVASSADNRLPLGPIVSYRLPVEPFHVAPLICSEVGRRCTLPRRRAKKTCACCCWERNRRLGRKLIVVSSSAAPHAAARCALDKPTYESFFHHKDNTDTSIIENIISLIGLTCCNRPVSGTFLYFELFSKLNQYVVTEQTLQAVCCLL